MSNTHNIPVLCSHVDVCDVYAGRLGRLAPPTLFGESASFSTVWVRPQRAIHWWLATMCARMYFLYVVVCALIFRFLFLLDRMHQRQGVRNRNLHAKGHHGTRRLLRAQVTRTISSGKGCTRLHSALENLAIRFFI